MLGVSDIAAPVGSSEQRHKPEASFSGRSWQPTKGSPRGMGSESDTFRARTGHADDLCENAKLPTPAAGGDPSAVPAADRATYFSGGGRLGQSAFASYALVVGHRPRIPPFVCTLYAAHAAQCCIIGVRTIAAAILAPYYACVRFKCCGAYRPCCLVSHVPLAAVVLCLVRRISVKVTLNSLRSKLVFGRLLPDI